jgi:Ca2+/Na+ antiporter
MRGKVCCDVLFNLVNSGGLAVFSVILLADGVAAAIVAEKNIAEKKPAGTSQTATGIRGMISIFAIVLVVIQVAVIGNVQSPPIQSYFTYNFEVTVTWMATILACYLYCFRSEKWEQLVEDAALAVAKENEEVEDLGKDASTRYSDGGGTKI